MKFKNVFSKKEYVDESSGEEKIRWYCCGRVKVAASGLEYLTYFHDPMKEYMIAPQEEQVPEIQMD